MIDGEHGAEPEGYSGLGHPSLPRAPSGIKTPAEVLPRTGTFQTLHASPFAGVLCVLVLPSTELLCFGVSFSRENVERSKPPHRITGPKALGGWGPVRGLLLCVPQKEGRVRARGTSGNVQQHEQADADWIV